MKPTDTQKANAAGMAVRTRIRAGGMSANPNATSGLRIRTRIRAGLSGANHNQNTHYGSAPVGGERHA